MSSRLALVEVKLPHEGPWTIAKGNESKIEILGLGHGELVVLELETPNGLVTSEYFQFGVYAWPSAEITRYRVVKAKCDVEYPHPTTVRILLNGKHKHVAIHEGS